MPNKLFSRILCGAGILLCVFAQVAFAADNRVESLEPVQSPYGSRRVVIDRIMPIIDGEPEQYSGSLLVRITDKAGTTTKQRAIEAPQIRVLHPPKWLNSDWAGFSYNISKNSNGIVFIEAASGNALQAEIVATSRRMADQADVKHELTDFEITQHGKEVRKVRNVVSGSRSVFPLYLREIPLSEPKPTIGFLQEMQNAIGALEQFSERQGAEVIKTEEASESFNEEGTHLALLGCLGEDSAVAIVPIRAGSAKQALEETKIARLGPEVKLSCMTPFPDNSEEEAMLDEAEAAAHFGGYRYLTSWKNAETAMVQKEFFETEDEPARTETLFMFTMDGKLEKVLSVDEAEE